MYPLPTTLRRRRRPKIEDILTDETDAVLTNEVDEPLTEG